MNGKALDILWIEIIKENCLEMNYKAVEASVEQKIRWNSESLFFITTTGFNDVCKCHFKYIFKKMNNKEFNPCFFESMEKYFHDYVVKVENNLENSIESFYNVTFYLCRKAAHV